MKSKQRSIPAILILLVLGIGALILGMRIGQSPPAAYKAMSIVFAILSLVVVIVGIMGVAMARKSPLVPFLALGWMAVTGMVLYKGQEQMLAEVQGFPGGLLLGLALGFLGLLGALGVYGALQQNLAGVVGMFVGGIWVAQIQILPSLSSTQLFGAIIGNIPALIVTWQIAREKLKQ